MNKLIAPAVILASLLLLIPLVTSFLTDQETLSSSSTEQAVKSEAAEPEISHSFLVTRTPTEEEMTAATVEAPFYLFSYPYLSLSMEEKMELLQETFPDGKYWNDLGEDILGLEQEEICTIVTDFPCNHSENGYAYCHEYTGLNHYGYDTTIQCLGFASMISDFLFGQDAPVTAFYDFESLQLGDQIRYNDYEHSAIVTQVFSDWVRVVQCNRDYETCMIEWNGVISREDLENYDTVFYSRTIQAEISEDEALYEYDYYNDAGEE